LEEKRREEKRKRKKNQTQLRLAYPKPKPGKEIHKREATVHKPTTTDKRHVLPLPAPHHQKTFTKT
jgi:hypothetical protein